LLEVVYRLSSSVTLPAGAWTVVAPAAGRVGGRAADTTLHGRPVRLRPVRATSCFICSITRNKESSKNEKWICLAVLTRVSSWLTKHFLLVLQRSGMTYLLTAVLQLVRIVSNITLNANFSPAHMLITTSNSRLSRI